MLKLVRPFVRPALRCFNCQRLGHVASVCKGKKYVPNVAENIIMENVERGLNLNVVIVEGHTVQRL